MDNNLIYLLVAYVVFWAATFIYVFTIRARQRRLEEELDALRALLKLKEGE